MSSHYTFPKRGLTRYGFSQRVLAEKVGVTQQAVAKWEAGGTYPRGEVLTALADLLHCTIDELFGRGEPGGAEGGADEKAACSGRDYKRLEKTLAMNFEERG